MLKVEFYGLCLFVWRPGYDLLVLLPNAQDTNIDLPDGSKVPRRHYPHYHDRNDPFRRYPLNGHLIELGPDVGVRPQRVNLGDLVRLQDAKEQMTLCSDEQLSDPSRVSGRVILRGGGDIVVTQNAPQGNGAYRFDRARYIMNKPACRVTWYPPAAPLRVKITPHGGAAVVYETANEIVIGNADKNAPEEWDCKPNAACRPGQTVRDDDFKCYYNLFNHSDNPVVLPIPVASCDALDRTGTTSTCYNGEWCPPTGCG